MPTIFELKEQVITDTPLLVFDCVLADGSAEHWCTHAATLGSTEYEARVMSHNVFEVQAASDQGVDSIPRITLVLANADSRFSERERSIGWKGARLTASFVFYDLRLGLPSSEAVVVFQGICNPPEEIREGTFRITATNRMNLQRLLLPQVRIQRRCGWQFPATAAQREEAIDGGANGKYSRYYRCGYSAGVPGGVGSMDGAQPFTSCGYTRDDCTARGMFERFGGLEFVPSVIQVRTHGDSKYNASAVAVNEARYNDFAPMVYGTAWYNPPIVFARNDGNLTRMEVLLGVGEMSDVLKVLVNDVEIPAGVNGVDMTGTGWYNVRTLGTRVGAVDPDFPDGDPYGSMAYAGVVVPNRLNDGTTLPRVTVLANGIKLPIYAEDGAAVKEEFSSNPAWIVLDMLRRAGWGLNEIDVASFARAASYCSEEIGALDVYGNDIMLPRFACNVVLQKRRPAGEVMRGVRNGARLLLTYGIGGKLELRVENTVALERETKPAWSNAKEVLDGGWPSYEFGESEILRNGNGEPSVRMFARSCADTPNRFSVEFQDSLNEYQQDSFSLVDPDDVARSGQEVAAPLAAVGLANFDQASRILKLNLDKSVRGNSYIEFDTSVKCLGVRPGDLITVTYLKEGLARQPFRVLKMAPGSNHRITRITAQVHQDSWYADSNGQSTSSGGGRRQSGAGSGVPRPLLGTEIDDNGDVQFGVQEFAPATEGGASQTTLQCSFLAPSTVAGNGPQIPLVSLAATIGTGGSLQGGQTLYYGVSGVDNAGNESNPSFLVRAEVYSDGASVTLDGLSFSRGTSGFRVYRGTTTNLMYRIADQQGIASTFTDNGLSKELATPPDANFDHADFYWRMELLPKTAATIHSATTVGNESLGMPLNRYRGALVRIVQGRGAGQERAVTANDATTLTLGRVWSVIPDASSRFAVAESGWQFGATSKTSPVQFTIPSRGGETVQVLGLAANATGVECAPELSTVTRRQLSFGSGVDTDVPEAPFFGLAASPSGGAVELNGISFADLANTHSITSATLTMFYWDELEGPPASLLANEVAPGGSALHLTTAGAAQVGSYIQVDGEVMRVDAIENSGLRYEVSRGLHGSAAAAHTASSAVYRLQTRTTVAPFAAGFFGSPYSGSWSFPIALPDTRIASAELFVTNALGNSVIRSTNFTSAASKGIRTLSGGQYSLEVEGYLAVDAVATPAVVVQQNHAVRDVFAVLGTQADADVRMRVLVNGSTYCALTVPQGQLISAATDGLSVGPLAAQSKLTLAIDSVGVIDPGSNLTVLIRL